MTTFSLILFWTFWSIINMVSLRGEKDSLDLISKGINLTFELVGLVLIWNFSHSWALLWFGYIAAIQVDVRKSYAQLEAAKRGK